MRSRQGNDACSKCVAMQSSALKTHQTIVDRASKVLCAKEALKHGKLSSIDYKDMKHFLVACNRYFSSEGIALKEKVKCASDYYD